jgi:hypothetical protein
MARINKRSPHPLRNPCVTPRGRRLQVTTVVADLNWEVSMNQDEALFRAELQKCWDTSLSLANTIRLGSSEIPAVAEYLKHRRSVYQALYYRASAPNRVERTLAQTGMDWLQTASDNWLTAARRLQEFIEETPSLVERQLANELSACTSELVVPSTSIQPSKKGSMALIWWITTRSTLRFIRSR